MRVGPLRAEVVYGESERFSAPILLVHGLWSNAEMWRGFTGFLAHRGWHCVAPHLSAASRFGEHVRDLRAVVAALDAPPVLVGHDLGGLLALELAAQCRAVVALAPLVPLPLAARATPALLVAGGPVSRWRGRPLKAPGGRWRDAYQGGSTTARESASLVQQLTTENVTIAATAQTPALVILAEGDPVVSRGETEELVASVGAEALSVPGGHAIPLQEGWQKTAAALHRWVVRRLGAPLLEFYENEDQYPV